MSFSGYNHKIIETVKFHEVDMLGVCNNAVYFNYFEDARINYLQELSRKYFFKEFLSGNSFVIMAQNQIEYLIPAKFDDQLSIYTKVVKVSKSSFSFKHIITRESDEEVIAKGGGILVHINKETKKSQLLPDEFHKAVLDYEGV